MAHVKALPRVIQHNAQDPRPLIPTSMCSFRPPVLGAAVALRRFGHETTVRPSLAVYNNKTDIDTLVATLHDLQSRWLR